MKKVKSIGKKVMSVGLAASLLLAPVSANKCFAAFVARENSEEAKKQEQMPKQLYAYLEKVQQQAQCQAKQTLRIYDQPPTVYEKEELHRQKVSCDSSYKAGDDAATVIAQIIAFCIFIYGGKCCWDAAKNWGLPSLMDVVSKNKTLFDEFKESMKLAGGSISNMFYDILHMMHSGVSFYYYFGKAIFKLGQAAFSKAF